MLLLVRRFLRDRGIGWVRFVKTRLGIAETPWDFSQWCDTQRTQARVARTCALHDEHVRSEVGVAAREVRAPEKLATALRAAQAFCHDANAVTPPV